MTDADVKNALELALLTSRQGPMTARALARMFPENAGGEKRVRAVLGDLARDWQSRALELRETAGGFQFISRDGAMEFLRRLNPPKPPRLSRPLTEILAFIAYRQPATRGDVEQARGVAVSSQQIAALEEYGWIEEVGRRQTPGRPVLYATTKTFLDDLGLAKLEDLPTPEEVPDDSPAMDGDDDDSSRRSSVGTHDSDAPASDDSPEDTNSAPGAEAAAHLTPDDESDNNNDNR